MPFAAMAAPRSGFNPTASEGSSANPAREAQPKVKSAADDVFVKPLTETSSALPGPQPEPAPQPPAPPFVGSVTATMTAALTATGNNGDGKADPGDTINYTVQLGNTTGGDATGLAFTTALDSHTAFVPTSIKSTPVAFDQAFPAFNEDPGPGGVTITLQGQDPDGNLPSNAFSIVPASGPSHGTLDALSNFSCTNGICSVTVVYHPTLDYNGTDSFQFKVDDGDPNPNVSSATGTVNVTINAVNDAPTFTQQGGNPPTPSPFNPAAVNEDSGAASVASFITNVKPGPATEPSNEDSQTVSFVITGNTNSGLFLTQPALTVNGASYPKTATLSYTPKADQNGTAVITYHAHDTGGTSPGVDDSAPQTFTITVNAVNDPPVVTPPAAFSVQANMKRTGLGGLLASITDADSGVNGCTPTPFKIKSGSISATSPAGGTISSVDLNNGTFDFDPPPGVTGNVTFTYIVTDNGCPGTADSAIVTATVSVIASPVIWFVDLGRATNGNGTLSNTSSAVGPFNSLASANTQLGNLGTNHRIFLYSSTAAVTAAVGDVVTLNATQWLIGQGAINGSGTPFDTFMGISPPPNTIARPALNGTPPIVRGTVTMKDNSRVEGLNINVSAGGTKGLTGTNWGNNTSVTIKDVNVTSAGGNAVDFSNTTLNGQTINYTSTSANTTITSTTGIALSLVNTTIGVGGLSLLSISANGASKGIVLNNVGSAGFTVTGSGTTAGSGGTIQNVSGRGIEVIGAAAVASQPVLSIKNMNLTNTAQTNGEANSVNCGATSPSGGNSNCSAAVHLNNVNGATFDNVNINGSNQNGINGLNVIDLKILNSTVQNAGNESGESGVFIQNLSGNNCAITNSTFSGSEAWQFSFMNWNAGTLGTVGNPFNISNSTFTGKGNTFTLNEDGILGETRSSGTAYINVTGSHFKSNYSYGSILYAIDTSNSTYNITGCDYGTLGTASTYNNSGAAVVLGGAATLNYNISNNTIYGSADGTPGNGTPIIVSTAVTSGAASIIGTISTNTIGASGTASSGCKGNCNGISLYANGGGPMTFKSTVTSNQIHQVSAFGIQYLGGTTTGAVTGTLHIKSNTIDTPAGGASAGQAILIQAAVSGVGGAVSTLCADIGNGGANSLSGVWDTPNNDFIRLLTLRGSSFTLGGMTGSGTATTAEVNAFVSSQNGGVLTTSSNTASGGGTFLKNSGAVCPLLLAEGGVLAALNAPSLLEGFFSSSSNVSEYEAIDLKSSMPAPSTVSTSLDQQHLDSIVSAAMQRWSSTGLTAQQISELRSIKFDVADLSAAYLGEADGDHILVDRYAQGKGWFIDPTPQSDSEFGKASATRRYTDPMSAPAGHVDLLTAIMHEMGHKLGLDDSYAAKDRDNLMYGYLTVGERRLPVKGQATTAISNSSAQTHFLSILPSEEKAVSVSLADVTAAVAGKIEAPPGPASFPVSVAKIKPATPTAKSSIAAAAVLGERTIAAASAPAVTSQPPADGNRRDASLNQAQIGRPNILSAARAIFAPMPFTGGTFPVNGTGPGFILPNNKRITITFSVTVNNPPNFAGVPPATPQISAQGTLQGSPGTILTDNVEPPAGAADPTVLNADLFNTTSTITGASPSNSTNMGQSVTFTASIVENNTPDPAGGTLPGGTATFQDGASNISGCVNVTVTSGAAQCTTAALTAAASPHAIKVVYNGDGNFDPSTSANFTQTVTQNGTTTAVSSSQNPSVSTQNVTFTATVTSNGAVTPPTGTVQFHEGATNYGAPVALTTGGSCPATKACASFSKSDLAVGPHTISGDYIPDPAFTASTGSVVQQVNQSDVTVAVSSSMNPSLVTQGVSFTAQVSSNSVITGPPTGNVQFKDGASNIGAAVALTTGGGCPVNKACATSITISTLTAGNHTITAVYNGDTNFAGTTGTLSGGQQVNKSNTATALVSSVNPSTVGNSVKFTATVTSQTAVTGPPAGTAVFFDGLNPITCTDTGNGESGGFAGETLNGSGVATCTTSALTVASHNITAQYTGAASPNPNGSDTFNGNTSNTVVQVVNTACTTPITVVNANDAGAGSLRKAIADVCDGGTITFSNTTAGGAVNFYDGSPHTINLADTATNQLTIAKSLTITGPGASVLTVLRPIAATNNFRIFEIQPGKTVSISGMTISNGHAADGTGSLAGENGGAILNDGTLTLTTVSVTNSNAGTGGAGGPSPGGNGGKGGGIYNSATGTLTIVNSTISGNQTGIGGTGSPAGSGGFGGGVYNLGTLIANGSTFSANNSIGISAAGGGIASASGTVTLINSTISGNTAIGDGGGFLNSGTSTAALTSVTVTGNRSDKDDNGSGDGGGVRQTSSNTLTLSNTIVAGNLKGMNGAVQQVETATVVGTVATGSTQVETLPVNDTDGAANNTGSVTVNVTINNVTTPFTVPIADGDTADMVADKIELALAGNTSPYTVASPGATVTLTASTPEAPHDASLNMTLSGGNLDPVSTSSDTTDGTQVLVTVTINSVPKQFKVPVSVTDDASAVAGKIRTVLTNDSTVNALYNVSSGTPSDPTTVVLTAITAGADDPTLNIAIADGTTTGLTPDATSDNTTPGYGGFTPNDVSGNVSGSFNLIGTGGSGGLSSGVNNNQVGVNPILVFAGLANNGGPTMTHALIPGSPAIDTGSSALTPLTTLGADIVDNVVTTVTVVNGNVIPASSGYAIRVDTEQMIVTARTGNTLTVTRGAYSTTAASHSNGANVYAAVDQRGLPRPVNFDGNPPAAGDDSDIGAYEQQNQPPAPGTPNLDDASDTGPNNSDNITSDTTPTFTISGVTSGATVKLYRDDDGAGGNPPAVVASGIAAGTSIQLTDPSAPASATAYLYSAKQTLGGAPESDPSADLSVTVNTSAPGTPSDPDLQNTVSSDSGASQTDNYTNSNTRVFDVLISETGSTVELLRDTVPSTGAVVVTSAAGNGSATIQLTDSVSLSDGMYVYSTRQTNGIGLTTNSAGSLTVTIDKTAPTMPAAPVLQTGSNSGSTADNITNDTTPTFDIGSTTSGERVELYRDANFVGFATGNAGTVAIGETTPVTPDGTYNYKARQVDLAGNTSSFSADLPVTIDTVSAPSAPDLQAGSDSGSSSTDNRTNKKLSRTFDVLTSETGATVELLRDYDGAGPNPPAVITSTAGNSSATIQLIDANTLTDGTYIYSTRQTDVAGNVGTSGNLSVVIDTTVTANAPDLDAASDTGASSTDNRTSAATPHVFNVVISETNSLVELLRDTTPVAGGSITSSGTVQLNDNDALADGTYQYSVRETDQAGNVNTSANLAVTIDTTAPTVVTITRASLNPTNAASVNFTVTFSEPVQVSTVDSSDFAIAKSGGITGESLGTITPLAPSGTPSVTNMFTVAVNTGTGDGTLRLDVIDDDTILDLMNLKLGGTTPGNGSFNSGEVYAVSKSDPFVSSITRDDPSPTNAANVHFTVTFSKPVTGVNIGAGSDFVLTKTGTIATESITGLSGSGTTYTVTVNTGTGDGTLRLDVTDDDTIQDSGNRKLGGTGVGNGNFTTGTPYDVDKTAPTITSAAKDAGQADPVTGSTATTVINFTVIFSEPVNFTSGDVNLSGTANPSVANVTPAGLNTTFNVAVEGMTQTGGVTITIPVGVANDAAGNVNTNTKSATVQFIRDDFSTLEVNSLADTDDGQCTTTANGCTLREAINAANADAGAETITFNPTVFAAPGPYTINLTGALPDLSTDMTISGPGANILTVQRNTGGNYRIFTIGAGIVNVTISGLTISNGNAAGGGSFDRGGGIFISSTGAVQVNNCTISGNTATADGGGIVSAGSAGTLAASITRILPVSSAEARIAFLARCSIMSYSARLVSTSLCKIR